MLWQSISLMRALDQEHKNSHITLFNSGGGTFMFLDSNIAVLFYCFRNLLYLVVSQFMQELPLVQRMITLTAARITALQIRETPLRKNVAV